MPMFKHAFPPQADGRTRYVNKQWVRDPNGPLLKKPEAPHGVRTPSGLIWGHDLRDFFWIQRIPGAHIMTIWSRSMIKELGENYSESEFKQPDSSHYPRRRHPWPLLKVPEDFKKWETKLVKEEYGIIDPGCEMHNRADYTPKHRGNDGKIVGGTQVDEEFDEIVKRLFGVDNEGVYMRNDPKNLVKDHTGRIYTMLWATNVRDAMLGDFGHLIDEIEIPLQTMHPYPFTTIQMDHVGVHVITALDDDALDVLGGPSLPRSEAEWKAVGNNILHQGSDSFKPTFKSKPASTKPCDSGAPEVETNGPRAKSEPEAKPAASTSSTSATDVKRKTESSNDDMIEETNEPKPAASTTSTPTASSDAGKAEGSDVKMKEKEQDQTDLPTVRVPPATMDELPETTDIPRDSPYSIEDIPKLEEFLPIEYYPDYLHVHDPNAVTTTDAHTYGYRKRDGSRTETLVYKRVFPKLPRDAPESSSPARTPHVAHVHLAQTHRFGVGNHSLVHHVPLTLPEPLSAHSRNGRVVVAAKTAFSYPNDRYLLQREARTYNAFPRHLSEDWCGYNLVTPIKHPVPVGPVVPKFYGYYAPVKIEDGKEVICDGDAYATNSPSPILLMEECGAPVEPAKFTVDQRSECYSMMVRLHYAEFIQNSFYVRNILVQPGPLTAPPEKRSKKTPSFRLIDYGRAFEQKRWFGDTSKMSESDLASKVRQWCNMMNEEDDRARTELRIENLMLFGYDGPGHLCLRRQLTSAPDSPLVGLFVQRPPAMRFTIPLFGIFLLLAFALLSEVSAAPVESHEDHDAIHARRPRRKYYADLDLLSFCCLHGLCLSNNITYDLCSLDYLRSSGLASASDVYLRMSNVQFRRVVVS
ncbi:hypothetical protein BDY19DRAFT_905875 [Irpex rosettiformis]|uniref:Uncharacterized protein n=1 Tax=Irpex rosettiformis TaxID=378272 RepID=A0ACB8U5B1_9APHY|nr:hypothetical protein BDY19DRAFT_905875 [Irpex rosettiformis]